MKNLKQLVLPCYKLEMAMSVEAWYFLHGSTDGICNLTYLLSLLSKMAVSEVMNTKRDWAMPSIPDRWTAPCWYWPRNGASDVRRCPPVGGFLGTRANPCLIPIP